MGRLARSIFVSSLLLAAACSPDVATGPAATSAPRFSAAGAVVHRPISEFMAASQNCTSVWTDPDQNGFVTIDLWGYWKSRNPLLLSATSFDGDVQERPLADGTAQITARIHARNALTFVHYAGQTYFGYTPLEIGAPDTQPALGDATFSITYINSAPGAPLPNVCDVMFSQFFRYQMSKVQLTGSAAGAIRAPYGYAEGTPGRLNIVQTGRFLYNSQGHDFSEGDYFPAEHWSIKPVQ